jgi:3',5'-cyclic AMP phosphodiesterase CpdA
MTGLGIPVANDILSATVGGEAWRIVNVIDGISVPGVVSSKCDAAVLQKYVDPANEFVVGAETDSVGLMEWLGGLLRILCAYLKTHAYGRVIQLLARLDYPGSSPIVITNEDLLGPVRMVGSESMSIDADFSYLQDGDAVAAGVQEFYEDTILGAMPKEFEMDLVGRTWSVGQTINWNGWLILLTSVTTDPIRNRASAKGMGGR